MAGGKERKFQFPWQRSKAGTELTPVHTHAVVPEDANTVTIQQIGSYLLRWHNLLAHKENAKPSSGWQAMDDMLDDLGSFDYSIRIPHTSADTAEEEALVHIAGATKQRSVGITYHEEAIDAILNRHLHTPEYPLLQKLPFGRNISRIAIEYGEDLTYDRKEGDSLPPHRLAVRVALQVPPWKSPFDEDKINPDPSLRRETVFTIPHRRDSRPATVKRGETWQDGEPYSLGLSDAEILQTLHALDQVISQAAGIHPLYAAALPEAPVIVSPEQGKVSWDYAKLTEQLVAVTQGREIPFGQLPTGTIDFGDIARETEALTKRQALSRDGNEVAKTIGVINNTIVFAPATPGTPWSAFSSGRQSYDDVKTREKLTGLAGVVHNHINGKLPNPEDMTPIRLLEGIYPLMGVGLPELDHQQGCMIFGIRSAETDVAQTIEERSAHQQQIFSQLVEKYGSAYSEAEKICSTVQHPRDLSNEQVRTINGIEDPIIREISQDNHLALYIVPFGESTGHRVDITRPILDQIPPKTVNERRSS